MKLKEAQDAYYEASSKTSDLARYSYYSGIVMLWFLWTNDPPAINGATFKTLAVFFIIGLVMDFLHYSLKTLVWGWFSRLIEIKGEKEKTAPTWLNWPGNAFFALKILWLTLAYTVLVGVIYKSL